MTLSKQIGYFVTGIGTDIGKTIASAVLVEKFEANYWKPIQAGSLDNTDTDRVKSLVSNTKSQFFLEFIRLKNPFSPHKAADLENKEIVIHNIEAPNSRAPLFCEGAGGLMAPVNFQQTMIDLIFHLNYPIILVSNHYLGSINHTLLSIAKIKEARLPLKGILFIGNPDPYSEDFILKTTGILNLGRIPILASVNPNSIQKAGKLLNFMI